MDVDIDLSDRDKLLGIIKHIPAAIKDGNSLKKHNTGVYCHEIPYNPITNTASFDYKEAESRGYFKIDFLNVNIYKDVRDEAHLIELMEKEPIWELLLEDEFTDKIFHINGHGKILRTMKPRSIEELAMVLAMIRPAKRHLIGKSWNEIRKEIWIKPTNNEYFFKHSHSISYAVAIVVHMNLLCEQLLNFRDSSN